MKGGHPMFQIHRMGCGCRHDSSFVFDHPQGYDGYLVLFIKTRAVFQLNGETVTAEPDSFIIYDRRTPQYYRACEDRYINDWILFDCSEPLAPGVEVRFNELIYIGEQINISQYFQLLADCHYRGTSSQPVGLLIRAMLTEVFGKTQIEPNTELPHYRELLDLRRQIYAQPSRDWSTEHMAKLLSISTPYLHALYKKAFGVTCNADVIQSRLEQAQHFLTNSGRTIEETAFSCGYSSVVHFSRQFKQKFGITPSEWRKLRAG